MVICQVCGVEGKVLTKHIKKCHGLTRKEYEIMFPNSRVVDEETSKRGSEVASYMHTDEVISRANESKRRYWETISLEEKERRTASMIASKRSDSERVAQGERARKLSETLNNSPMYEQYRKDRDERFSKMVSSKWEDKEWRSNHLSILKSASSSPSKKAIETRRNNMSEFNRKVYSDLDYRSQVCSPLWGKGSCGGSRGGIRVSYISKDQREFRFRSLWELRVAIYLDDLDISWDYESLEIPYGDHHYIPDFYLDKYHMILEVKPRDFIDEITEMKRKASESLGYRFKYVTEYDIEFIDLKDLDYKNEVVQYRENVQRLSKAEIILQMIKSVE